MKKIQINTTEYPKDCRRIQTVLADRGYEATIGECETLWQKVADSMCASWLMTDSFSDEHIFTEISNYIDN